MPWYVESVKKLGSKKWFSTVGKRFAPGFDRAVIKLSGGRLRTGDRAAIPTLLLTCTGRKSGRERHTPLLFLRDGEKLVVAGSNWGQQHDPAWELNLETLLRATVIRAWTCACRGISMSPKRYASKLLPRPSTC